MSKRTLLYLCVFMLLAGGCSDWNRKPAIARLALSKILSSDTNPIEGFLHPKSSERLDVVACWMSDGLYLVFLAQNGGKAVAYDLGRFRGGEFSVDNYGFGELDKTGQWRVIHENEDASGDLSESNGGIGTLRRMIEVFEKASGQSAFTNISWHVTVQ